MDEVRIPLPGSDRAPLAGAPVAAPGAAGERVEAPLAMSPRPAGAGALPDRACSSNIDELHASSTGNDLFDAAEHRWLRPDAGDHRTGRGLRAARPRQLLLRPRAADACSACGRS